MQGEPRGDTPREEEAELDRLADDWITLWQSEIAAMAADREAAEGWAAAVAAWAGFAGVWARAATVGSARLPGLMPFPWPPHEPAGPAGAAPPARPAAPDDAPGDGGGARDGGDDGCLRDRLAELERRLADLEGRPGGDAADPPRPRRRRPRA